MSNHLAVAHVTAAFQDLLSGAAQSAVPGAEVRTLHPGSTLLKDNFRGINLFLFQVLPNVAWRNVDLELQPLASAEGTPKLPRGFPQKTNPGQDPRWSRFSVRRWRQTPLNLHYLVSFFGSESDLEPQRLLGAAIEIIGRNGRLPQGNITQSLANRSILTNSDLDFQTENIEAIKLTQIGLSLEELSKLWSVFFQVPYALSIAFEASVVLIESPEIDTKLVLTEPQFPDVKPSAVPPPPPRRNGKS